MIGTKRRVLAGLVFASTIAGGVVVACSDDPTTSPAAPDGGVVFQDGGIVFQDGGVVFQDGGLFYRDGGPVFQDGGIVLQDGGILYIDGGVIYQDGGVVYQDGGVVFHDGGPGESYDAGPNPCIGGSTNAEPLGPGLYGCGGSVAYADRGGLCHATCRVCSPSEYRFRLAPQSQPTRNYWLNESLERSDDSAPTCFAGGSNANVTCEATQTFQPMRVCVDTKTDPEGNSCNWSGCGLDNAAVNDHFGGCSGNTTAGTLCCADSIDAGPPASTCASGTNADTFTNGMNGCSGTVGWTARATLCAADSHVCTAAEWKTHAAGAAPTHNYWTDDNLRYSGSDGTCAVSTTVGSDCTSSNASTAPMHVCGAGTTADPDGNRCVTAGCSLEYLGATPHLGGCFPDGGVAPDGEDAGSYKTAGTLCCCGL